MLVAFAFLLLALTLAARTWVRLNEPRMSANRRAARSLDVYSPTASAPAGNGLADGGNRGAEQPNEIGAPAADGTYARSR